LFSRAQRRPCPPSLATRRGHHTKKLLIRFFIILIAALAVGSAASATDFVVSVEMKNVGADWSDAKVALIDGAFKSNVNVTVVVSSVEVPLAKH
jgi:hypothetical protein